MDAQMIGLETADNQFCGFSGQIHMGKSLDLSIYVHLSKDFRLDVHEKNYLPKYFITLLLQ